MLNNPSDLIVGLGPSALRGEARRSGLPIAGQAESTRVLIETRIWV